MLKTLKLVQGAVSSKDLIPELTHFFVYQGRIQGYNGRMSIDAALPEMEGYSFVVPADKFIKAIDSCEAEPKLEVTDKSLMVKQGKLRVRLPLLSNDASPRSVPDEMQWETEEPLLPALRAVAPFIANDASRAWSIGVWISEDAVHATNNVILVKHPSSFLSGTGVSINLPGYAVEEILRNNQEPVGFGISDTEGGKTITLYFDGWWLKVQLLVNEWPVETVTKMLQGIKKKSIKAVPAGLADAVNKVLPFCPDPKFPVIQFSGKGVATADGEHAAAVEGFELPEATYSGVMLQKVLAVATHATFTNDNQNIFLANELLGIFVSMRTS